MHSVMYTEINYSNQVEPLVEKTLLLYLVLVACKYMHDSINLVLLNKKLWPRCIKQGQLDYVTNKRAIIGGDWTGSRPAV